MDWDRDREILLEKQKMELDISHTLLASRITELRVPLEENVAKIRTYLLPFHDLLAFHVTTHRSLVSVQKQDEQLRTELACVSAIDDTHTDVLTTLESLYDQMALLQQQVGSIAQSISKSCMGFDAWHDQHAAALQTLRGRHIAGLRDQLSSLASSTASPLNTMEGEGGNASVREFLMEAGQGQLWDECERFYHDVDHTAAAFHKRMMECLSDVMEYQAIAAEYPPHIVYRNRCYVWKTWREQLLEDPSVDVCNKCLDSSLYVPTMS